MERRAGGKGRAGGRRKGEEVKKGIGREGRRGRGKELSDGQGEQGEEREGRGRRMIGREGCSNHIF